LFLAGAVALVLSLLGTRYLIDWLKAHHVGQPIHEDVPDGHVTKAGTPTMGGVAIAGAGVVGAFDDWIKVSHERNLGLSKRAKMGGLLVVAVGFAVACVAWTDVETTLSFTRWNYPGWNLTDIGWIILAVLLIAGTTNAVNLTDGLDGLAAGSSIYAFITLTVVAFWAFRHPADYQIAGALDLAVSSAAMVGAILGFLWWNAPPAQVFMGDTGSLAIGAGMACLALTLNVQLLLPIVGALFVFETLSVIVQVGSFRMTGKRVFRMAPVHHHFELGGWPETTVIIRFWILAIMAMAVALGLFFADSISAGVVGS
jgi:phospho-N-acetylmuramoyl-pentapeptide-transferase